MTTPKEPLEAFQAFLAELDKRRKLDADALTWLASGPSRYGLLKEAYYAGYGKRADEEATRNRRAIKAAEDRTPAFIPPGDQIPASYKQEGTITGRIPPRALPEIPFQDSRAPKTRLDLEFADAERVHKEQQRYIPTELMPAVAAETGPQPSASQGKVAATGPQPEFSHTEAVWQPNWPESQPEKDIIEHFSAPGMHMEVRRGDDDDIWSRWGAPGPVRSPFFGDDDAS